MYDEGEVELAFPRTYGAAPGMTLRDYFAAKAMQGFLSDPNATVKNDSGADKLSRSAYSVADAMLRERSK